MRARILVAVLAMFAFAPQGVAASDNPPAGRVPPESITEIDPIDIPPEHDPLAHAFHRTSQRGGFYLRLSSALGVHNTRLGPSPWDAGDERHAHGFGSGFGLDVGAFVVPWLALHLDATAGVLWNGNVHRELAIAGDGNDQARVVAVGLAPAATFYTPHAFFFKTAFGVGGANVKQRGPDTMTDPGFYMDLVAGKDLYVDRHFALGIQFQVIYMLLGDERPEDEARVRQFLFGISAAFDSR